ncbi:MAG: sigma-70 family RNA polymerase sigma factor, partial [Cellvibrionaceae bacterium]|nr:sigma-70 family RNA polymerase sigma factor [Cellvibrionaceae bacterium]
MGSSHELEDVVQDVFAKLAKEENLIARLPADRSKWRSYLVAMANNLVVDMARYKQVRRKYLDKERHQITEADRVEEASPERIALSRQELERVKAVILELRPRWRQAFILNRFKHQSYPQIAQQMGVSVKQIEK